LEELLPPASDPPRRLPCLPRQQIQRLPAQQAQHHLLLAARAPAHLPARLRLAARHAGARLLHCLHPGLPNSRHRDLLGLIGCPDGTGSAGRPTTSTSFSSKRRSFESLNVFTRCGFKPRADQIRCTVAGLTPCALAIERQLQCVSPIGCSCSVAWTISAILSAGIDGLRPRPGRTPENAFRPSDANRLRHASTVAGETPA